MIMETPSGRVGDLRIAIADLNRQLKLELIQGDHLPKVTLEGIHRHLSGRWIPPSLPPAAPLTPTPFPLPDALALLLDVLTGEDLERQGASSCGFLADS
jgi:hypothetical protein